jgi:hypothetical protein
LQNPLAPPGHAVFALATLKLKKTVARKPKRPVENKPADEAVTSSANGKSNLPELKKKPRASAAAPKKKKPATARKSAAKAPGTTSAKPAAPQPGEPTDEEIRMRAYFIAERRHKLSLPGDSNHDWIEARRQLLEEAAR